MAPGLRQERIGLIVWRGFETTRGCFEVEGSLGEKVVGLNPSGRQKLSTLPLVTVHSCSFLVFVLVVVSSDSLW